MTPLDPLVRLLPPALRPDLAGRGDREGARRLEGILGLGPGGLDEVRLGRRLHYRPFPVAKPDGRERRVLAPSPALKRLQRALLDGYLAGLPVHPAATAFRPGASTAGNARPHAKGRLVAAVDLRDFFESTAAARVRSFFARQGWRGESLRALMTLCVFRGGLPQGAPTSPCLSNLVNRSLDERLDRLARESGAAYTRYGDDLTFSWRRDRMPAGFREAVESRLAAAGYRVQPLKGWRVSPIADRPVVAGVVLKGGGRLGVPGAIRRRIWLLRLRFWWSADPGTRARLRGVEGYARSLR